MKLSILGIRGIPAQHGGFETFAEKLSVYLSSKDWDVTVYCQEEGEGDPWLSEWQGISRVHIPVKGTGALSTIVFDWKATWHASNQDGLFLTLGYNTAIFNILQRLKGQINLFNMDGIEWRREKWGFLAKAWFWLNERAGCWIGNHLIADHPKIKEHLSTRTDSKKVTMIPYGADEVNEADIELLKEYGIAPQNHSIIIARPEPENSILEIVRAFSQKRRNHYLVVLGSFAPDVNVYHSSIFNAASDEVIFPGAIYDSAKVKALRLYCSYYLHGHRVGGTNPSLVEALGAGCAVIAHDNHFNRWVAATGARYFQDEHSCAVLFNEIISDSNEIKRLQKNSRSRFSETFTWDKVLFAYESLLADWQPKK
ncbi:MULTISPECIES: DUF1972 domain-containing protein [unclassified Pseudomonas]|uniref:DUF1972 domain-containing protein n=1 Tax=unclassified Pseudomonas TaxID=196821 RepID=UPI0002A34612|nr:MULTISPECIES: DUF1972 domain-containing protein [unclassified Pseudomonas]MBB1606422.1 glycosyl transferase [Pseudomonas sp. UMC76]MBB1640804.1 glycosyl transferase [Pseudomonas sp. UME83]UNY90545.1 DUF1972 domain-containing protein [Pseudomonas sp. M1]